MRHEASPDSGIPDKTGQFRSSEVQLQLDWRQDTIQWLRLQPRLTLTVCWPLRNCLFYTRAFVTICSPCTPAIGCWRKRGVASV